MSDEDIQQPRECRHLLGNERCVAAFETALQRGKVHHAWLLCGARGVGKSSFAHLASRALIARDTALTVADQDVTAQRIALGNAPELHTITREMNDKTGKMRPQIVIDQVRGVKHALSLSAERDEWRCVIVDAAEDMNGPASNAILKLLEEPPARVTFFLVSHTPGRLLPTIRSRCRRLDFQPLGIDTVAQITKALRGEPLPDAVLRAAHGSVGAALELSGGAGPEIATQVEAVIAPLPDRIDRSALHRLGDLVSAGSDSGGFLTVSRIVAELAARRANEAALHSRTAIEREHAALWAEMALEVDHIQQRASGLNLDLRQAFLDMFTRLEETALRCRA